MANSICVKDIHLKKDAAKCYILKLHNAINIPTILAMNSLGGVMFSAYCIDDSCHIFHLKQTSAVLLQCESQSQWKRIFWDTNSLSHAHAIFWAQDDKFYVKQYSVDLYLNTVVSKSSCSVSSMGLNIENFCQYTVDAHELLDICHGYFIFLVNGDTLCLAEIVDNVCVPTAHIPLPMQPNMTGMKPLDSFQVCSDVVAVLNQQAKLLFIYSMQNCDIICQIDLESAGLFSNYSDNANSCFLSWKLSPSLSTLMCIDRNSSRVLCVDLVGYIVRLPQTVYIPCKASMSTVGHASHIHMPKDEHFSWILLPNHVQQQSILHHTGRLRSQQGLSNKKSGHIITTCKNRHSCSFCQRISKFIDHCEVDDYINHFSLPNGSLLDVGYNVSQLFCSDDCSLVVVLHSEGDNNKVLCFVDTKLKQVYFHSLSVDQYAVLPHNDNFPTIIFSSTEQRFVIFPTCIKHKNVINRKWSHVGTYQCDAYFQTVYCTHSTIPLHAFQFGLDDCNIDAIMFYIFTKEDLFSRQLPNHDEHSLADGHSPLTHCVAATEALFAFDLFLKASSNYSDSLHSSKEFYLRLLDRMIAFYCSLLTDALLQQSKLKFKNDKLFEHLDLDKAIDVLLTCIPKLQIICKICIEDVQETTKDVTNTVDLSLFSADLCHLHSIHGVIQVLTNTQNDTLKDVLDRSTLPSHYKDLIQLGCNILLQWSQLVRICLQRALFHIHRKEIEPATFIIKNLGLDACSTVWQMTQFSTDRSVQLYVIEQLLISCDLNVVDQELIAFASKWHTLYYSSLTHCQLEHDARDHLLFSSSLSCYLPRVETNVPALLDCCTADSGGIDIISKEPSCTASFYWLQCLSNEMKELILLECVLYKQEGLQLWDISPLLQCNFWLTRNEPSKALGLLDSVVAAQDADIMTQLLHCLSSCSGYVQHVVKRYLLSLDCGHSREAVYYWCQSVEDAFRWLSGLLQHPHPFVCCRGDATLRDAHRQMTNYCCRFNLVQLLWMYYSVHRLNAKQLEDMVESLNTAWLRPLIDLHLAVANPHDYDRMVAACLSHASLHWNVRNWSLLEMFQEGHVMSAMATLAYVPDIMDISQVLSDDNDKFDTETLKQALQQYPMLLSALMPTQSVLKCDIDIYQMLKNNMPLSSSVLFGWQSANAVLRPDAVMTFPHFSRQELVEKYGHVSNLRFTYFLKQGRAAYAFLSFLNEKLPYETSLLSHCDVEEACHSALLVALQNCNNRRISCAVVVFVEMLGLDSAIHRMYIHVGEVLLAHRLNLSVLKPSISQDHSHVQWIVNLLQHCQISRPNGAHKLLSCLEDAIVYQISTEGISSTSSQAALKWTLPVVCCVYFRLPVTSTFLRKCAEKDHWLSFLWFAQLHQLPTRLLQSLLSNFPSYHLQQHLGNILLRAEDSAGSQDDSVIFSSRDASHSLNDSLFVDNKYVDTDMFQVLFGALSTSTPWKCLLQEAISCRNPVFAELAACCYEDAGPSTIVALCAWLVALLPSSEHVTFINDYGKCAWEWSIIQLEQLVTLYLDICATNTLCTAFFIFYPTSPLVPFLKFVAHCCLWRNFEECKCFLDQYKDKLASVGVSEHQEFNSTICDDSSCERMTLDPVNDDRPWLERMTHNIICHMLVNSCSLIDSLHFLHLLIDESISLVFNFDVINLSNLYKMVEILHRNQITDINLALLIKEMSSEYSDKQERQKALDALAVCQSYEDAFIFGHVSMLDVTNVVLKQLSENKQHLQLIGIWNSFFVRKHFIELCVERCARLMVSSNCFLKFIHEEIEQMGNFKEKAFMFALVLSNIETVNNWLVEDEFITLWKGVFTNMWYYRIKNQLESYCLTTAIGSDIVATDDINSGTSTVAEVHNEILHRAIDCHSRNAPPMSLNDEEANELQNSIADLLFKGRVSEGRYLAQIFNIELCPDVTNILACHDLCTGTMTVYSMDTNTKRLMLSASSSGSPCSTNAFSLYTDWSFLEPVQLEFLSVMEKLLSLTTKGSFCCQRMICCYKIACLTEQRYQDVVIAEECFVIQRILRTSRSQKRSLAIQYLKLSYLPKVKVVFILVDQAVKCLHAHFENLHHMGQVMCCGHGVQEKSELLFQPMTGDTLLTELSSLCDDKDLLGQDLLHAANSCLPGAAIDDGTDSASCCLRHELSVATELLVMSHKCYTPVCNMEGISNVLRSAVAFSQKLASNLQYDVMARLLTGIGRYNEMVYVFDCFYHHERFNTLLVKGVSEQDQMKISILEYLKRFHEDDEDTYCMVALRFSMHREIAQMLEQSGHKLLRRLHLSKLGSTDSLKANLNKCRRCFMDASESYVKDQCLDFAVGCLKWARLVSLQLDLLQSGTRVIHMSEEDVKAFAASHPEFYQAFVVADAYHVTVDWSESLFLHVLLLGNNHYLEEFQRHIKLSSTLIKSTLLKLKREPSKLSSCSLQVRKMLRQCRDVWLEHRIAQELGLTDIVKESVQDDWMSSYIADMRSDLSRLPGQF